jgi:phosphoglycolate phosphatase
LAAQSVALALVTSNTEANVRPTLGPQVADLFACYECGASIFGKRAKLRRALKRCGVSAQDAIAIGDETRDIEAASAEGIAFGAVAWGYTDPDALRARNPARMFSTFGEITAALTD